MVVDIVMPKMGESITEGTILEWRKQVGDTIKEDEILLEIGTDKVDSEIPSPTGGTIIEILAQPNDVIPVGEVIARVETDAGAAAVKPAGPPAETVVLEEPEPVKTEAPPPPAPVKPEPQKPAVEMKTKPKKFFTPVVKKIAAEAGISLTELADLTGSGRGGRVTKQDILAYLKARPKAVPTPEAPPPAVAATPVPFTGERQEMTHMRKLIAEHMRQSLDTSAHVYVITEVDMTKIAAFISAEGPHFKEREGFNLTYTPFIIQATVKALNAFPEMNASLEGTTILYHKHINIGLAVALEKGLMVPVIPCCEELNFLGLCRKVHDLAVRTRNKQISPDELQGSTFSITNFGVFNVTIGTPIINQPNVGILGVGTVKKRPVVLETESGDAVGIKSMMFLSLGFDHRLIDGAGGSRFLDSVREHLETLDLEHLF
jgi:2-oxoglutarate dehydrogenase E2 component (dihydrolipoamide succinyltransferase)